MNDRRRGLHKDVRTIFQGSVLPAEASGPAGAGPAAGPGAPSGAQVLPQTRPADAPEAPQPRVVRDEQIEALRVRVGCSQDHLCYRSGFSILCRARPILGGRWVECLERRSPCRHRLSLLGRALCRCAIRQVIARKHGK
ncbi:MAG: hypothetical protein KBE04_08555 [Phycisphaerae bacterium]|nr:hypothetical protein [Phycisphaerae bacterium]